MRFLDRGENEAWKAAAHAAFGVFAAALAAYNLSACRQRRRAGRAQSQHLLWNAAIYVGLVGFEVRKVARHLEDLGREHRK